MFQNRNDGMLAVLEINIQGIFGNKYLKESFDLDLKRNVSIRDVLSKIDRRLKMNFFKKNLKKLPEGVVVLVNGQPIESSSGRGISVGNGDQISILRVIAGG
ncbi:MAG: MoaD/ThiS family protein [Thermodesulfobacteriota bacterium]|nr:MoaD/ThiS family protein [Thermodesulfobacteriota bacterium]